MDIHLKNRNLRQGQYLVFLVLFVAVLVLFPALLKATDDTQAPQAADAVMPVPDTLVNQIQTESSQSLQSSFNPIGCDQNHLCPEGQECIGSTESSSGYCTTPITSDSPDTVKCDPGQVLKQVGTDKYICENECPSGEKWSGSECVADEEPIVCSTNETLNGNICECSSGYIRSNEGVCVLDNNDGTTTTSECRSTGQSTTSSVCESASGCSYGAKTTTVEGYMWDIVKAADGNVVSEIQSATRCDNVTSTCCEHTCESGQVDSSSACSGGCYKDLGDGCFECGTYQATPQTVTPESYSACSSNSYASSRSTCPSSCATNVTRTLETTTLVCENGFTALSEQISGGGTEQWYCCANVTQGSGCYDSASGQILQAASTCTVTTAGTDAIVNIPSTDVSCSSDWGGGDGSAGNGYIVNGQIYPPCSVTLCTAES